MTLVLAITMVATTILSAFLVDKMWKSKTGSSKYLIYSLFYAICIYFTFNGAINKFGMPFALWLLSIFAVAFIGFRFYNHHKKYEEIFSAVVVLIILGGIVYFGNTGYEVISTWSEKIERPIVQINGIYVENEQTEIMGDCTFYKFYLEDDNGVLKLHPVSEKVCDLRLTDGKAVFEKIIHHDIIKHKYSGRVKEEVHSDWTLYVPEG